MDVTPASRTNIGLIGLGLMGSALAARLIASGYGGTGFDIDAAKCAHLARDGGTIAASTADIFKQCRTIVLAVFAVSEIETILSELPSDAAISGTTLICITTCAP